MNVFGIILIVLLVGLCIFLIVDTTIYIVKKSKLKKQEKLNKNSDESKNI